MEVLLCVFVRLKNHNVTFGKEIPQQKAVETGEHCQALQRLNVLPMIKDSPSGKDDPGEHQQEETKGYCFGFIIIFWEVFSHIRENKAKSTQ